jgi:enoyl-CoA hydratase/carnithine racemase
MSDEILVDVRGGMATLTLNRPHALNALSFGMLERITRCLDAFEEDPEVESIEFRGAGDRAFCAGGDVRSLYESFRAGRRDQRRYFEVEYAMDLRIHNYPKPTVAVMDGITMGGGMGIAQGCRSRVVTDRSRLAMPETAIGLFPDVGGSYFLSRLPGKLGLYLGLTGVTVNAADALYCGLANASAGPIMQPGELERLRPAIDEHFSKPDVEAILRALESETRPELGDWAAATRERLARASPTMLKATFEQLKRGAKLSAEECFRMELGMVLACFEQGDFLEGIRALLVDKDRNPRWNPDRLEAVSEADVQRFFKQGIQ